MLNVTLPAIAVEPASNGYVVQWRRPATAEEKKVSSAQYVVVTAIAATPEQLLAVIAEAIELGAE